MKQLIREIFDMWLVKTFFKKPLVLNYLLNHERRHLVIDNLCFEISGIESMRVGKKFNKAKLIMLVEDIARMFASHAVEHKEQQLLSKAEINRRITESSRMADIEAEFDDLQKEALSKSVVSYPTVS